MALPRKSSAPHRARTWVGGVGPSSAVCALGLAHTACTERRLVSAEGSERRAGAAREAVGRSGGERETERCAPQRERGVGPIKPSERRTSPPRAPAHLLHISDTPHASRLPTSPGRVGLPRPLAGSPACTLSPISSSLRLHGSPVPLRCFPGTHFEHSVAPASSAACAVARSSAPPWEPAPSMVERPRSAAAAWPEGAGALLGQPAA